MLQGLFTNRLPQESYEKTKSATFAKESLNINKKN